VTRWRCKWSLRRYVVCAVNREVCGWCNGQTIRTVFSSRDENGDLFCKGVHFQFLVRRLTRQLIFDMLTAARFGYRYHPSISRFFRCGFFWMTFTI